MISDEEWTDERVQRLLAVCDDWARVTHEPLHEHDCGPCDLAAVIAGSVGAVWDNDDPIWDDTPVDNGEPGDSKLDQLTRIVAWVLHRQLGDRLVRQGGTKSNGMIGRKVGES